MMTPDQIIAMGEAKQKEERVKVVDRLTTLTAALVTGKSLSVLSKDEIRDTLTIARALLTEIEAQTFHG